jgi:tyrosinase
MADIRHNQRDLSAAQKSAFVKAVLALKNNVDSVLHPGAQKRYDDYVEVHKNAMVPGPAMIMPMPHGGPLFFPWHRVLLRQFEQDLQRAGGDASVTIPYWDWSHVDGDNPFTADFLGGDGDLAQGGRVATGPFAFSTGHFPIRVWDDANGDPALLREFGEDTTSWLPTSAEIASGLAKVPYYPGPSCWERVAEGMLHNPVHRWVGGNMVSAASPNDPVFFLHHCNLDRLWEQWKTHHPTSPPYTPTSGGHGIDVHSTLVYNAAGHPAPWHGSWTVQQTINPADLGYSYA